MSEKSIDEYVEVKYGKSENIIAHSFDVQIKEDFKDRGYSEMHMWCKNPDGQTILIRIEKYPFSCYLELPEVVNSEKVEWTENCDEITQVIKFFKNTLKDDMFYEWQLEKKYKLHYYGKKYPMLKLFFHTGNHMRHCLNLLKKVKVKIDGTSVNLVLWETEINIYRKMMTQKNAQYSQWMSINAKEVPYGHEERISVYGNKQNPIKEYYGEWNTIRMLKSEECSTLVYKLSILVFDIETYSPNHKAMPKSLKHDCACYLISCVYQVVGQVDTRVEYAIIMGDCDDIPGKKIIRVKNEVEEMHAYCDIINKYDPDMITGYNIVPYDYPYMNDRLMYMMSEWKPCSRIQGEKPYMKHDKLVSNAYGINLISTLELSGRITTDTLQIIKRDHKLDKFTLDFVSYYFLKKNKHDVSAEEMFIIYENLMNAQKKYKKEVEIYKNKFPKTQEEIENKILITNSNSNSNSTDLQLTSNVTVESLEGLEGRLNLMKIEKNIVKVTKKLNELQLTSDSEKIELYRDKLHDLEKQHLELISEFLNKKVVRNLRIAKKEMTRVTAYCIQDSILVIELIEKLNIWISMVAFSGIVGVTPTQLFSRGQQIRCQSQIYDECCKNNIVLDKRESVYMHYKGAYVVDPLKGLHNNIIGLDFNSLYPSIIIAYNMCYTTFLKKEDWLKFEEKDVNIIKFDQTEPIKVTVENDSSDDEDEEDKKPKKDAPTHVVDYEFRFVKKHIKEGILPRLLNKLLAERKKTRAEAKVLAAKIDSIKKFSGILMFLDLKNNSNSNLEDFIKNNSEEIINIKNQLENETNKQVIAEKTRKIGNLENTNNFLANLTNEDFSGSNTVSMMENILKNKIRNLEEEIKSIEQTKENKKIIANKTDNLKEYKHWWDFISNVKTYDDFLDKFKNYVQFGDLEVQCLDKKQLAQKVSANSMYGFLGAQKAGIIPFIEGALCVTAMGRILIGLVNTYVIDKYGAKIVYGDTDSSMIDFGIKDPKDCHMWGHKMEDEINGIPEYTDDDGIFHPEVPGLFPKPLRIEFEKGMRIFCICPKKYAYIEIEKDGEFEKDDDGEYVLNKKGILLARRDNTAKVREVYKKLLMMIMFEKKVEDAFKYLIDEVVNLIEGNVPIEDLCVTRGIGANYKSDGYFLKVFVQELARMGNPVQPGDRIASLIVKTVAETQGEIVPVGLKMRTPEMYYQSIEESQKPPGTTSEEDKKYIYPLESIDSLYYLAHSFQNPIDQLFKVGFKDMEKYESIGYEPQHSRKRYKSIITPMEMIVLCIEDFLKFYKINNIQKTDKEKFSYIVKILKTLPDWFIKQMNKINCQ